MSSGNATDQKLVLLLSLRVILKSKGSFYPRVYKQSHSAIVVQGKGGGGVVGPLLWLFAMLEQFEKILPSVESLSFALKDEVYVMESWPPC